MATVRRLIPFLLPLGVLVLAPGCGREAPYIAPGSLTVTSTPAGAGILLDGVDTGMTTPHSFTELEPDLYEVSVQLDGWLPVTPEVVDLQPLDIRTVAFALAPVDTQTGSGGLTVVSSPEGARILIDGGDTGQVTPATVTGLTAGEVSVALALESYLVFPPTYAATVYRDSIVDLDPDAFILRPRRTVILEGFANVDCLPCPQLTANLVELTADPVYGPDRVVFLEFSVSWPDFLDPFYRANMQENTDRYTVYQVQAAPTLFVDGARVDPPLDFALMKQAVDAALAGDPGVIVDVVADASTLQVAVTVTLLPVRDLDLGGHILYTALYEDLVVMDPAPGSNGQTEFHHVFRDRVDAPPALGALTAGVPQAFAMTLARGDRAPDAVTVVAFIQDTTTRAVVQAGSTAPSRQAAANLLVQPVRHTANREGHQP